MEKSEVNKTQNKTAHANFKKGLSDYNDGENVTHHLGNDDYKNRNNLDDPHEDTAQFDGKVAGGNDLVEGEEDLQDDESV